MQTTTDTETKTNFANFSFYILLNPRGAVLEVGYAEILRYIANPLLQWPPSFQNLVMKIGDSKPMPAHLPNLYGMMGFKDVTHVMRKLRDILVDTPGMPPTISGFTDEIIDPEPVLDLNGTVYMLGLYESVAELGSQTDVLVAYEIAAEISAIGVVVWRAMDIIAEKPQRFQRVHLKPSRMLDEPLIPKGSRIVLWNARSVARLGFVSNLERIVEAHNPVMIMLTETRISKPNFRLLFEQDMGSEMGWEIDPTSWVNGGTILLWDKRQLRTDTMVSEGKLDLRILSEIKAVPFEELQKNKEKVENSDDEGSGKDKVLDDDDYDSEATVVENSEDESTACLGDGGKDDGK